MEAPLKRMGEEDQSQEDADRERITRRGGLFAGVALAEGIENEFNPAGDSQFLEDSTNVIPYGIFLYVRLQDNFTDFGILATLDPLKFPLINWIRNPAGHSPQAPISLAVIVPDPAYL
jgi:hypothetical protein